MIVDFHTHVFPPQLKEQRESYLERDTTLADLYRNPKAKMATAEDLIQAMDDDGVDLSVVLGIGWTDDGLAREANDYVIDSVRRYPDRLAGFAGVNPSWGEAAAREADRCARSGLSGIGELHPDSQSFDLGDPTTMTPLMEAVREHGLVVTTHSSEPVGHSYAGKGRTGPEVLMRFVHSFSDVSVVCAHWGGGLPFYALMPEVRADLSNVYFDTAASPFLYSPGVWPAVASLIGADKILLGSDYPLLRAARLLREIEGSALSPEERERVTGRNAADLLGR